MNAKQLKAKSVDELMSLRKRITSLIMAKQTQMKKARERVLAIAKSCGVSLRDLGIRTGRGPDKKPRKTSKRGARSAIVHAKKPNGAGSHATH